MTYRSRAFLDLCRDRPCANCGADDGTIVPAHRNHGKGMGFKATDAWVAPLCLKCHKLYDSGAYPRDYADAWFLHAYAKHMDDVLREGRLTVDGAAPVPPKPRKPSSKTLSRTPPSWRTAA